MAETRNHSDRRVLSYESQALGRDWVLIASRVVHVAGFIASAVAGVGFYDLQQSLGDGPVPFWLDAAVCAVIGGIVASPIFGLALLVERFGHLTIHCSGPARRVYSFCVRKWLERRPGR